MMDLVVNHTSDQHDWFKKSRLDKENAYRDFYFWRDPVDGHEPNNWGSYFSGPAWTFDDQTKQYYLHLFAKEQPDLNWDNPALREHVFNMMNWWGQKGIDGFRMDVISQISKPAGLPNAPKVNQEALYGNEGPMVANGPHVHEYLREMNTKVLQNFDWITVEETGGVTVEEAQRYANLDGSELNMVFQFEHMDLDINPAANLGKWNDQPTTLTKLRANLTKWQQELYGQAWNSLYWNNHDQPRVVSRFGNDQPAYRVYSAKMLAAVLHFMQGTPYIYQGEELGMTNSPFDTIKDFKDLESLNAFHELVEEAQVVSPARMMDYLRFKSRDNARTPMQWSNEPAAGFTTGRPWLKVNPNYKELNAQAEQTDPDSVLDFYKRLIELRHTLPVVTTGRFELLDQNEEDPDVFAYQRIDGTTRLILLANFTDQVLTRAYKLPDNKTLLINNYQDDQGTQLRPYEVKVYLSADKG